ncbi:RNA-binding protein [Cronobacter phage vB_CsaM_GAP32]|uniref:DUF2828 domain-containing protein n=1 Tax=Cronobacter phage vB_CsaM_GAP32 TaxID=1141136 RepID=K4F5X3_9CAUD|nr:RNA-binding protein [Cronobacter phage vB_CsaM_GAP32]AFC21626.1 hypothetical protein GAP32_176 [Cronobacter phage vB_CsaM_GAP32]
MSAFKNAVNNVNTTAANNRSTTANGGASLKSTLNPLVDLFFMIGSLRNKDLGAYKAQFDAAYAANPTLALQMILWARDVRGGAGERNTPRELLKYLEVKHPEDVLRVIPVLAEFGRWDDLLIFKTAAAKSVAYSAIAEALQSGNGLCAKWMPRIYKFKKNAQGVVDMNSTANKNRAHNNKIAREIMATMNINERTYRKLLASLSNTVEQKMCANEWDEIDYGKLPSVASSRYLPAFMKRDENRYREYLASLEKGEGKVNAGALFPYDVTRKLNTNSQATTLAVAQWEQLKNFMGENTAVPMVDTSGSMTCRAGESGMSCMDIAISLGLYIADKQEGAFKDLFLNFSSRPRLFELKGNNIAEKHRDILRYQAGQYWGGSTNVEAAFQEVLRVAVAQQVPADQMPKNLIVLSDMEFNASTSGGWNATAYNKAKADFARAGYELPTVVFWNLNARAGNNPVRFDQNNVALVSGFSPSVLEAILSGEDVDPVKVMLRAIDTPRYRVLG